MDILSESLQVIWMSGRLLPQIWLKHKKE